MRVKQLLDLLEPTEKILIINQNKDEVYDGLISQIKNNSFYEKIINAKATKLKCNRIIIYSEEK